MFNRLRTHTPSEPGRRERERWARSIASLLADADRVRRQFVLRSFRPVYDPALVAACAPSLREIRAALLDPAVPVTRSAVDRLRTFLCDGARSPLFGGGRDAAARGARELRSAFVLPTPARDLSLAA